MSVHVGNDLSAAIIELLTDAGFLVGDGEAPAEGGWQGTPAVSPFRPYVDIHPIPGGNTDGTISEPNADSGALYQLIAVGANRTQAESIGDDIREVMATGTLNLPAGRQVILRRLEMLGGSTRDDSLRGNAVQPSVWLVSDRWRIFTTPAT